MLLPNRINWKENEIFAGQLQYYSCYSRQLGCKTSAAASSW